MALKTFNIDEEVYKKFAEYCKKEGISMSKKVENFIKQEMERILKGKGIRGNADEHPLMKYC